MCHRLFFFLLLSTVSVLGIGDHWDYRQRTPTSVNLLAAAWTGTSFVATGEHGAVLLSSNGSTWLPQTSGSSRALRGVAWTGTRLVAVGDGGTILTSTDGSVWSVANSPLRAGLHGVAWTGALCVAVGDAGVILTSTDGLAWTLRQPGNFADLRAVHAIPGQMVAVGAGGSLLTSVNGTTWNTISPVTTQMLSGVAHSGSRWVAVGDGGVVLSSTNGTAWSAQTSGVTTQLNAVHWDGSRFIAVGSDGVSIVSADGLAWNSSDTASGIELQGLASGSGVVVAVGDSGGIITTVNATGWTLRSTGVKTAIRDLTRADSQWVAVGEGGGVVTSANGDVWSPQASGTTNTLNGVAWSGSLLVAVGDGGVVITSPDGVVWTARNSSTSNALLAVTYTGTQFVAVGARGTVRLSSTGVTWTTGTSGTTTHLRGVAASSSSQMVAVGDSGVLIGSSNGTAWTLRTSGVSVDLNGVGTNGSVFIAVGAGGRVLKSADAVNWSSASSPLTGTELGGLRAVRWSGEEFIATGHLAETGTPGGGTIQSPDGTTWSLLVTVAAPPLNVVGATAGQTLLAGVGGTVLGDSLLVVPEVQFLIAAGTLAEDAGQLTIAVTASSVASSNITVPVVLSGDATVGPTGDATISANAFVIPAGQTEGSLIITARQDLLDEPDEALVLTLQTPNGATLGAGAVFTLTLTDDDEPPSFGPALGGEMVPAGSAVEMGFDVMGDGPITLQWLKNGVPISRATSSRYLLPTTSVSSAGSYRLRAKNAVKTVESPAFELAVVDLASTVTTLVQNKTATLSVNAAGNSVTYQWLREGEALPVDSRITGAATGKLVITGLTGNDEGLYRCLVMSPYGSLESGTRELVVTVPPTLEVPTVAPLMVSQWTSISIPSGNRPTRFSIANLPSGLVYNAVTGEISGRPLMASGASPFQVTVKASNAAGFSATVTLPLTVLPLPAAVVGSYQGTVDHAPLLSPTSQIGGRISVTTSANGRTSGSVTLGTASWSFSQPLDAAVSADPSCSATIVRKGQSPLRVNFTIQASTGALVGTVSDGLHTTDCRAWPAMSAPFGGYTGYYTAGLKLLNAGDVGVAGIPQGHGYAYFNVGATGAATGVIRMGDGSQVPLSATLRSNGGLVLFTPLYGGTGSILGTLNLAPGSPVLVQTAGLNWVKLSQSVFTRSYPAGFGPLPLQAAGARYTVPTGSMIIMNLVSSADDVANAALEFAQGGAPDPASRLNVQIRYSAPAVLDPQTLLNNPGKVSLAINPATGLITGGFVLSDHDVTTGKALERKPLFYGLIARDLNGLLFGFGHFQLARMPDNYVVPPTSSTTSALLSGSLLLRPVP